MLARSFAGMSHCPSSVSTVATAPVGKLVENLGAEFEFDVTSQEGIRPTIATQTIAYTFARLIVGLFIKPRSNDLIVIFLAWHNIPCFYDGVLRGGNSQ